MEPFVEAILNVLTIVALISATAFIIIFLVDLFMSITNKNGSIFFRNRKDAESDTRPTVEKAQKESFERQQTFNEEYGRPEVMTQNETLELQPAQSWDEEAARREQEAIANRAQDEVLITPDFEEKEQKQQQFVSDFDDFDSLFDEPEEEATSDKREEVKEQEEVKVEPVEDFDEMIDEINKESVSKYEESRKVEIVEPIQDILEEVATPENEDFGIKETAEEKVENIVEEQKAVVEPVEAKIINIYEYFPIDALNDRLAKLQERLKINERDLKANRKEYNPLARVNRNLKRDQEKLRRKEAIIARKKVLLYGVNNYVDIDEEKAKKLSEDLDLLDGLRLSVQHCEEVMEQNKDRFPILESTNRILVEQNQQIKDDIAEVKAAIDKLNDESK